MEQEIQAERVANLFEFSSYPGSPSDFDKIYRLAGGQPYLVQQIAKGPNRDRIARRELISTEGQCRPTLSDFND